MADYTLNYNLKKPAGNENFDVADQNGNMGLIDIALKENADDIASVADELAAHKADEATLLADYIRQPGYGITSGANTYTITLSPAPISLDDGMCIAVKIGTTNTGAATLNPNSLGAISLVKSDGSAFAAGELVSGRIYTFRHSGTSFILQGEGSGLTQVDYVGFSGFLKKCEKVSNPTALSAERRDLAATTVGGYALFGGGGTGTVVDAYDASLTRSTPIALSAARHSLAATTVGGYALFGGGGDSSAVVDAYDASLTRSTPIALSAARGDLAATTVGGYALFGGGYGSAVVDAYDASLTRSTPIALSAARRDLAATTVGGYALFGGGYGSAVVDAYDASLTRSTPIALSAARGDLAATTVGGYALFGGGGTGAVVDAYDASLTRSTLTELSAARARLAAITVGGYALFGGGSSSAVVDAYDASLTRSTPTELSAARYGLAATTVGGYALFGGGYIGSASNIVDAYLSVMDIPVTIGSKYNFGSGEQTAATTIITAPAPITGYIKYKKGTIN